MKLIKHEHSAFVLESGGRRLGVDFGEFTSAEKLMAAMPLDAICVSHIHSDHYSEAHILAAGVPVAAPSDVVAVLPKGIEAEILRPPMVTRLAGFAITPTPANHGPKLSRPIENYGLVVERDRRRIYFVGDMAVATPPPDGPFDLVLVPVDGGGFVFDAEQAIAFIRSLNHRRITVPIHDGNPAEPDCLKRFERLARGVCEAAILKPGQSVAL